MATTRNLSLERKTASRIAAVQGLYSNAVGSDFLSPAQLVVRIKDKLKDNKSEQKLMVGMAVEPNYTLLEAILAGVEEHGDAIDKRVDSVLDSDWTRARTGRLLIAILQCAIYELFFYKDSVKHPVIVDEYTRITSSFFDDKEVNFIYSALSTLVGRFG